MGKKVRGGDSKEEREEFSAIMMRARYNLRMTHEELAEKLGISSSYAWYLEQGKMQMPAYVIKRLLKLKNNTR